MPADNRDPPGSFLSPAVDPFKDWTRSFSHRNRAIMEIDVTRKERFQQLKSDLRLTAEEVAELTGRSSDTVRGYTSAEARRQPPLSVIEKLKHSMPIVLVHRGDDGVVSVQSTSPLEVLYVEGDTIQPHTKSGRTDDQTARITHADIFKHLNALRTRFTMERVDDFMKGDSE